MNGHCDVRNFSSLYLSSLVLVFLTLCQVVCLRHQAAWRQSSLSCYSLTADKMEDEGRGMTFNHSFHQHTSKCGFFITLYDVCGDFPKWDTLFSRMLTKTQYTQSLFHRRNWHTNGKGSYTSNEVTWKIESDSLQLIYLSLSLFMPNFILYLPSNKCRNTLDTFFVVRLLYLEGMTASTKQGKVTVRFFGWLNVSESEGKKRLTSWGFLSLSVPFYAD